MSPSQEAQEARAAQAEADKKTAEADKAKKVDELKAAAEKIEDLKSVLPPPKKQEVLKLEADSLSDEDYAALKNLDEEQIGKWMAEQPGLSGVIKYTKFMKRRTDEAVFRAKAEAKEEIRVEGLKKSMQSFKKENADLFGNPVILAMVKGLDQELLARSGHKSVKELSADQLDEHLKQLNSLARTALQLQKKSGVETELPSGEKARSKVKVDETFSLSDLPGIEGKSAGAVDADTLEGLELERYIAGLKTPHDVEAFLIQ